MKALHTFLRAHPAVFYGLWALMGILQASFTELTGDEAYYWAYAQAPAWSYFDHPPMLAWAIALTCPWIPGALGVRLLPVLLYTAALWLWDDALTRRARPFYRALVLSTALLHLIGFQALPDAPLFLFYALSLRLLRPYLKRPTWKNAAALGLVIGLMGLSKYHGALAVVLALLAAPRLLLRPQTAGVALVAAAVMAPHLYDQYTKGWPALSYHFVGRSTAPYSWRFTAEYGLILLAQFLPLAAFLLWPALARFRPKSTYERILLVQFFGTLFFFLLTSFKGRVEGHWPTFVLPVGFFLAATALSTRFRPTALLERLTAPSVLLVLAVRLLLIFPQGLSPLGLGPLSDQFHQRATFTALHRTAGDLPVAFLNSYRDASLYKFYTGAPAFAWNNIMGRQDQYDLWATAATHQGQPVLAASTYPWPDFSSQPAPGTPWHTHVLPAFENPPPLFATPPALPTHWRAGQPQTLTLEQPFDAQLLAALEQSPSARLVAHFLRYPDRAALFEPPQLQWVSRQFLPKPTPGPATWHITPPAQPGTYTLCIGLSVHGMPAAWGGALTEVVVE